MEGVMWFMSSEFSLSLIMWVIMGIGFTRVVSSDNVCKAWMGGQWVVIVLSNLDEWEMITM